MAEQLNLIQKLAGIRAMSDSVKKDKKGYNYSYADITEILAKVTAGMKKYGVSLVPSIVPGTVNIQQHDFITTRSDKQGNIYDSKSSEMLFSAEMIFRWLDDSNPSDYIDVPWIAVGMQQDPSQAVGSGLTYCTRYFLTEFFQIAQSDLDVDAYRSKQKAAAEAEDKAIAGGIITEFDTVLRKFLADNPDSGEEIKQFISKYVKSAKYTSITDPQLAAKLFNDFKQKYMEEN